MAKGKINHIVEGKGYGFIQQEGSGTRIFFHASSLRGGTQFDDLEVGIEVEVETKHTEKGLQAISVKPTAPIAPKATPELSYRFLNPYNFVRFLEKPDVQNSEGPSNATVGAALTKAGFGSSQASDQSSTKLNLLDKCPPPPHDRFVGFSGKIECTMENVTPLFVADPEKTKTASSGHKSHDFFKINGQPVIPATSLRGPIRSLFEAATNSCMSTLSNAQLSYHFSPGKALGLVPARVEKNEEEWQLRLLPGTRQVNAARNNNSPQHAAWLPQYLGQAIWQSPKTANAPGYATRKNINLSSFAHGEHCHARLKRMKHPNKPFSFWNVEELVKADQKMQLSQPGKDESIEEGYLCITNQNIENKHDERFFFHGSRMGKVPPVKLGRQVCQDYENLIRDYQQRHADSVSNREKPEEREGSKTAFSRFIIQKQEVSLQGGEMVYALINDQGIAEFIAPVSIPRRSYKQKISELLPDEDLKRCAEYQSLCSACRMFGWTYMPEADEKDKNDKATAYAGRVSFSHAKLLTSNGILPETPLAILSSPKPTTTLFYLERGKGQEDGYSKGNYLRGRKFYRHHRHVDEKTYRRVDGKCDDQNHTVRDALAPGTKFEFTIRFENLATVELGALLWTLEMDNANKQEKCYHRIGFAKPLGFGSCVIKVENLGLLNPASRYASLEANSTVNAISRVQYWIDLFKSQMTSKYELDDFELLPNIQDLRALLSQRSDDLPVHYPRTSRVSDPEGKNFEWFIGNKRKNELRLPFATEDTGLPLISRDGRVL